MKGIFIEHLQNALEIHQWEKKNNPPAFISLNLERGDNLRATMMWMAMKKKIKQHIVQRMCLDLGQELLSTGRLERAQW